jgi:hypothetical protein
MAKDGDKRPPRQQETLRVRVRAKNPQIGRRIGDAPGEEQTVHADPEEHPTIRRAPGQAMMDDDATEVASRPPPIPREDQVVRRPPPPEEQPTERPNARRGVPTARPRANMEMLGTAGAGAMATRLRLQQRAEEALVRVKHPALKPYRGLLNEAELSALERTLSGELDAADQRGPQTSPKRSLERLINGERFAQLSVDLQAALLRAAAADPREIETTRAASRIAECGALTSLPAPDRPLLLEVLRSVRPRTANLLADLAERTLRRTTALADRDCGDQSLVSHLAALADARALASPLESAGFRKDETIHALIATLAHPEQLALEEAADGVLAMMEFALADAAPAEAARLWRALVLGDLIANLPSGQALRFGAALKARPATKNESPLRQGLELLAGIAHPRGAQSRAAFVMPGGHGIDADVTARALGHLFGVTFSVAAGASAVSRQIDRILGDGERVPPAFLSILYDGGERLFLFHDIKDGRVQFRAPHGASSKPRGARRSNPDRLVDDPDRGLESISTDELMAQVGVALIPRT